MLNIFILHACCQLTGIGRWQVALSLLVLAMCGASFGSAFRLGLSHVNVAAHREEIQLHEVALQFPEGFEARRAEPAAAPDYGRRGGGHALATSSQTKGTSNSAAPFLQSYHFFSLQMVLPI